MPPRIALPQRLSISTARAAPRVLLVDDDGDNPDVRSRVLLQPPLNAPGSEL
ncbi:MAG: hypothetical protein U0074_02455 [Kouleothrix sp.]